MSKIFNKDESQTGSLVFAKKSNNERKGLNFNSPLSRVFQEALKNADLEEFKYSSPLSKAFQESLKNADLEKFKHSLFILKEEDKEVFERTKKISKSLSEIGSNRVFSRHLYY
ncbi:hypothetical protein HXZ94_14935 [Empedobacter falsenii]|uniref:hypothetical protein n=1 Tax=Empedobacter falsenii TaxID=343874 RepID=UPI0025759B92|nr:hypothetical protein [Empedobacter falsenii]MDM1299789.1 hypothetical protein [Empedobacter falsenii]MDM1319582.1 hypothetical protein [Empedobacter falsenii]